MHDTFLAQKETGFNPKHYTRHNSDKHTKQGSMETALAAVMQQLAAAIEDETGLKTTAIGSDIEPDETKNDVGYVMTRYRCGNAQNFKKADTGCTDSPNAARFVIFLLRDKYTPVWNEFGLGEALQYRVEKSVQIG